MQPVRAGRDQVAVVVLAAGGSTRMGEAKQLLLDENDQPLVVRAARSALDLATGPVFVVVGAEAARLCDALRDMPLEIVENDEWKEGMASTIRAGTRAVMDRVPGAHALLLMTCDMPTVDVAHLRALATQYTAGAVRVASAYQSTIGNPAIVPREEWDALLQLRGDRGAKTLFEREGTVTVPLVGGALDLDTPEDVARWRSL